MTYQIDRFEVLYTCHRGTAYTGSAEMANGMLTVCHGGSERSCYVGSGDARMMARLLMDRILGPDVPLPTRCTDQKNGPAA
jgi:hypothetical protein